MGGRKATSQWRNLANLSHLIKVNMAVTSLQSWYMMKMALHLFGLPPKNPYCHPVIRISSDKSKLKDILQNVTQYASKFSVIENKERESQSTEA